MVLGNGFSRSVILPCLRHVPGIRVVGLSSPNLARAQETASLFGIETAAPDHRELLARCRPDLVFVVTPPHRHAEQSIDALEAGCHVVCEKPTALDASESARMLAAAGAAKGRVAWIDHELRFHPGRQELLELVRAGRLGAPRTAGVTIESSGRRDPNLPWSWWSDAGQGGGALGALGSHVVDALRALLGEVAAARGMLHTAIRERRDPLTGRMRPVTSDDVCSGWLRFRSGALATFTISLVEGRRQHRITVAGETGWACLDEQGPLEVLRAGEADLRRQPEWGLPDAAALAIPDTDWARSFLLFARALERAIRSGDPAGGGIPATFDDGHRTQLVLDAIRSSARTDAWIELPEPDAPARRSS